MERTELLATMSLGIRFVVLCMIAAGGIAALIPVN